MGRKKEAGTIVREWLTEKMGNPVMTSKKKNAIRELDEAEVLDQTRHAAMVELQESGKDYDARIHTSK
jgi:hypothetical protein